MDNKEDKYSDWVRKIQEASGLKTEDAKKDVAKPLNETKQEREEKKTKISNLTIGLAIFVFLLAISVRIFFLFNVSDPQNAGEHWYGDTYHHWQVAYLTQEVGLHHGFMRLWDLKGMEYFWGPLHPILMMIMFAVTGSVSIVDARILSLIFGSIVIVSIFFITNRYWGRNVAIGTSLLAIFHPVSILNDTSGMLEPIGYSLLFLGILALESSPLLAGVLWGLASMARAEAWMYGAILLFFSLRILKKPGQIPGLVLGWGIVTILYMKYLLDSTGNAIYPFWWNFLANARGEWSKDVQLNSYQLSVQPYLITWFVVSVILILIVMWRKWWKKGSGGSIFLLFGFANWAFIGGFMGMTSYLTGFEPWFWYIRFFMYPYIFASFLIALFFLYYIPKKVSFFRNKFVLWLLWLPILATVFLYQVIFWKPIMEKYDSTRPIWSATKTIAHAVGQEYQGGKVLIQENDPSFTYALVYYDGIKGSNILGQMYDPFYYIDGDPYVNWGKNRKTILTWIKKEDIRLISVDYQLERYAKLFKKESNYFEFVKSIPNSRYAVYRAYPERIKLE